MRPCAIIEGLATAQHRGAHEGRREGTPRTRSDACVYSVALLRTSLSFVLRRQSMQDLHAVVMGVLVGPAAAAAADVLKVFSVSSRAARLVMSKVVRSKSFNQRPATSVCLPQGLSC